MNKRFAFLLLFLAWALAILGGYYYFHKPLTVNEAAAPLQTVFHLATASLLVAFTGGLGRKLIRAEGLSGLARMATEAATGIGVTALAWLLLGLVGGYQPWLAWVLLAVGLLLLRRPIWAWLGEGRELLDLWRSAGTFERLLLVAAVVLALNHLWIALAPPIKYDALTYHLQLPRLYLAAGRLTFEPAIPYWGHPQVAEMLYTWAMSLGGLPAAGAFGWWVGILLVGGAAGLARWLYPGDETHKNSTAVLAAAALLAAPTVRDMLGWSYNDLFSGLFGLAAFACFYAWQSSGRRSWLAWVGLLVGFAVGTKFTAGILALTLYPVLLFLPGRQRPALRDWLVSGLLSLLAFSPWAIKNLVATGSPLFPYFFPTAGYSAMRLEMAHTLPESIGWFNTLLTPIWLTWQGIDSAPGPGSDIGILLLLFALPALLLFWRSPRTRPLLFAFVLTWLTVAVGGARIDHLRQTRLYFVVLLPVLGIAAGWGWAALKPVTVQGVRLARIAGALIVLVLTLTLWQDTLNTARSTAPQVLLGVESTDQYLDRHTGAYIDAMRRLDELPPESRVLMLWEARGLYAPLNATADPWIDRWRVDLRETGSAEGVLARWKAQGYTQIILFNTGLAFVREDDPILSQQEWAELDRLLDSLPDRLDFPGGFYSLYRIPD
jgi:hypothetical protein